jgi:hypothetical protein
MDWVTHEYSGAQALRLFMVTSVLKLVSGHYQL